MIRRVFLGERFHRHLQREVGVGPLMREVGFRDDKRGIFGSKISSPLTKGGWGWTTYEEKLGLGMTKEVFLGQRFHHHLQREVGVGPLMKRSWVWG